jgi:hypothetical protein
MYQIKFRKEMSVEDIVWHNDGTLGFVKFDNSLKAE